MGLLAGTHLSDVANLVPVVLDVETLHVMAVQEQAPRGRVVEPKEKLSLTVTGGRAYVSSGATKDCVWVSYTSMDFHASVIDAGTMYKSRDFCDSTFLHTFTLSPAPNPYTF